MFISGGDVASSCLHNLFDQKFGIAQIGDTDDTDAVARVQRAMEDLEELTKIKHSKACGNSSPCEAVATSKSDTCTDAPLSSCNGVGDYYVDNETLKLHRA